MQAPDIPSPRAILWGVWRRGQPWRALALVAAGPLLVVATLVALGFRGTEADADVLRAVLARRRAARS